MATVIDARGLACPEPVLRTKQALKSGEARYEVLVDNQTAKENVTRYAKNTGYTVETVETPDGFQLLLNR